MQQVKIYIETDSSSPKATEKHYGYVLEVMVSGQAVTREGYCLAGDHWKDNRDISSDRTDSTGKSPGQVQPVLRGLHLHRG